MKRVIFITAGVIFVALAFFIVKKQYLMSAKTGDVFFNQIENKIWLHKIYDYKQADSLLPEFRGLETDIVYDKERNVFDIRHDENDTFQNRTLDEFWSNIDHVSDYYFWLDFKNLNNETLSDSKIKLLELLKKHKLENHAIVESWNIRELDELSHSGIFTSYWSPHFDLKDENLEEENLLKIKKSLSKSDVNAVSAHSDMTPFLTKHFSDCSIHVWTNGLFLNKDREKIDSLSKIESLKIILVDLD